MDITGRENGLAAFEWFEVRLEKNLESKLALITPRAFWKGALTIRTGQGDLQLQSTATLGKAAVTARDRDALAAAFGGGSGSLTLLRTPDGWRALDGRVMGGAKLSGPGRCADAFVVAGDAAGGAPRLEPPSACEGQATIVELGRRAGQQLGAMGSGPRWISRLSDPRAAATYVFDRAAMPRRSGLLWNLNPRDAGPGRALPGPPLCLPPDPLPAPDPGCLASLESFDRSGLPRPDCRALPHAWSAC